MYRSGSNRFIPLLIIGLIVIAAIAALVFLGRLIFGGQAPSQVLDTRRDDLLSTGLSRSVRMTVRGPIVANEKFTTYRITISPDRRTATVYEGYLENVRGQEDYPNNVRAYEEFVYALDKANFLKEAKNPAVNDDMRGVCATGRLYEFELRNGGSLVRRLWTSTCQGSPGTFRANVPQVQNLFRAQIPSTTTLFSGIAF